MGVYKCAGRKHHHPDGDPYCDHEAPTRWMGPCPQCGKPYNCDKIGSDGGDKIHKTLASVSKKETVYLKTGLAEFDHVIGGGLVKGATILFGGHRGAGKSSLLVSVADGVARGEHKVIYASGEERAEDVGKIAHRLGVMSENIEIMGEQADVYTIIERADELKPVLIIFDSLQVMTCSDVKGDESSTVQGIAVTNVITSHCKRTGQCAIIVNHMAKDGSFAGSETVAHLVDTIIMLNKYFPDPDDEEEYESFPRRLRDTDRVRLLESDKNRNGREGVREFFEMDEDGAGLKPVKKKSKLELV